MVLTDWSKKWASGSPLAPNGNDDLNVATIAEEARASAEQVFDNPFASFASLEKYVVGMFVTRSLADETMSAMRRLRNLGLELRDVPEWKEHVRALWRGECVKMRTEGITGITAASLMRLKDHTPGFHYLDMSPTVFINGLKPGQDMVIRGPRGSGKTDFALHWVARPWIIRGREMASEDDVVPSYVVTEIGIDNLSDWKKEYECHTRFSSQLRAVFKRCRDWLHAGRKGLPWGLHIVGEGQIIKPRARAATDLVVQQQTFDAIARHSGLATVTIYQDAQTQMPTYMLNQLTHDVKKSGDPKRVTAYIDSPPKTKIFSVWGLPGLPDLQGNNDEGWMEFQTHDQRASLRMDINITALSLHLASVADQRDLTLEEQFEEHIKYIDAMRALEEGAPMNNKALAHALAVFWVKHDEKTGSRNRIELSQNYIYDLMQTELGMSIRSFRSIIAEVRKNLKTNPMYYAGDPKSVAEVEERIDEIISYRDDDANAA